MSQTFSIHALVYVLGNFENDVLKIYKKLPDF